MRKEVEAAIKRIRITIMYLLRKSGKTRHFEDINLIIEQSERVQELEDKYNKLRILLDIDGRVRMQEQNERYREALEKILHQHELEEDIPDHDFMWNVQDIARKALESESNE